MNQHSISQVLLAVCIRMLMAVLTKLTFFIVFLFFILFVVKKGGLKLSYATL